MTDLAIIAAISIFTAGFTISIGCIGPSLGEAMAAAAARPSPKEGPMQPMEMVKPAVKIEIAAIMARSVMVYPRCGTAAVVVWVKSGALDSELKALFARLMALAPP